MLVLEALVPEDWVLEALVPEDWALEALVPGDWALEALGPGDWALEALGLEEWAWEEPVCLEWGGQNVPVCQGPPPGPSRRPGLPGAEEWGHLGHFPGNSAIHRIRMIRNHSQDR